MAPFDENALRRSLETGERRLALSRQRKRQQKKTIVSSVLGVGIVIPLVAAVIVAARGVPPAPLLVVTWPKTKERQVVASGAALLPREGQPFTVEILDGANWEVAWQGDVESHQTQVPWAPQGKNSVLKARCKFLPGDWQRFFTWLQPARVVSISAANATRDGDFGRVLNAQESGVWISPRVLAAGHVGWDARALPLLSKGTGAPVQTTLAAELAAVKGEVSPALWQIVGDFEGTASKPAPDGATFAALQSEKIEADLPVVAREIAQKLPKDSVKFVLRLDKQPPQGILRLSFDGKGERRAWIRRPGQNAGGPFEGWERGEEPGNLAPSLPR